MAVITDYNDLKKKMLVKVVEYNMATDKETVHVGQVVNFNRGVLRIVAVTEDGELEDKSFNVKDPFLDITVETVRKLDNLEELKKAVKERDPFGFEFGFLGH